MAITLDKIILSISASSVPALIQELNDIGVNSQTSPELTDLLTTLQQIKPLVER